jgi:multidrug efflux pump subunit AcrB
MSRFFIDRPIFAGVLSIVIVLLGFVAALVLPVAQYPDITPPTVTVTCSYPGASAKVVADTVAAPIEQQVNGVENMLYMSSQCTNDGGYSLTVTFALGTNVDTNQVLVQNRVSLATPVLPDVVKQIGVTVKKKSPSILLVVNLYSETDPATGKPYFDQLYLSNYATIQLKDEIARLQGIGDVFLLGQQDYSMRIWVDPDQLASRGLTATDVIKTLQEQNVQVAAGQIGQAPVPRGLAFQYTMTTLGRLETPEQFGNIILKTGRASGKAADATLRTGETGAVTFLRDVARVELGARNQDVKCRLDGKPSVGMATYQLPGSNALDTANNIKRKMRELEKKFPPGLKYAIVYDTTPFVEQSVHEVMKTLVEAIILVTLVVLLFLQDWKAVILPLIAVIVSLVGTCAVMALIGFSLNNLTLFGLVLAIGIVVDDAIVVLENIERHLAMGKPVRQATIDAMDEITGPIIAITLVLSSVLLPSAFLGGITGQFFRQFALTISVSMVISAINAMTVSPALATVIFKTEASAGRDGAAAGHHEMKREALPWWIFGILAGIATVIYLPPYIGPMLGLATEEGATGIVATLKSITVYGVSALVGLGAGLVLGWFIIEPVNGVLGGFFRGFNRVFDRISAGYGMTVGWCLRLSVIVLLVYAGLLALTGFGFTALPSGFIPPQDKGYLVVNVELPDSASLERTEAVNKVLEKIAMGDKDDPKRFPGVAGVDHTLAVPGMSFLLNSAVSSNYGSMFIILKPFEERKGPGLSGDEIGLKIRDLCAREIPEAKVGVFGAPAVDGLGNAGGFKLMIQERGKVDFRNLQAAADKLSAEAVRGGDMVGVFNSFRSGQPQLYIDVDRTKCKTQGVTLTDVFDTLQVFMGGYYVNDFNFEGRTWQVNIQAEPKFRVDANMVPQLKVRNSAGDMIPLGAVSSVTPKPGPVMVTRYNMFTSATVNGATRPGFSTGQVIDQMGELADKNLPATMTAEWTELTYLQQQAAKFDSVKAVLQNPLTAFAGAVILVFLVLAAQYESWGLPMAVILVVPMCLLAAMIGIFIAKMDLNIFVQVGFVVLVGLACKNAILVVEFARDQQKKGHSAFDSAVEASKERLRPIVMTSLAFILGVFPLVVGTGAGAEMRRTLGTAVFSGMIGVTLFGLFLTPVFYYVIRRERRGKLATRPTPSEHEPKLAPHPGLEAQVQPHPPQDDKQPEFIKSDAITDQVR